MWLKYNFYDETFEFYLDQVYDLLNKRKKLSVLEDGKAQVQVTNYSVHLPLRY